MSAGNKKEKGYVPRISQLDSLFLTSEAYSLIKTQLLDAVKYTKQTYVTKLEPEIDAFLELFILRYTVQKARSSVGQQLLRVKYEDTVSSQRLQNYILTLVLGKWLNHRTGDVTYMCTKNAEWKETSKQCVNILELVYKVMQVINLLMFLHEGAYPSVLERLFGLKQISSSPSNARRISYTYFTRELLWHGFAELLAFILPLINLQYFHQIVRKLIPSVNEDDYSPSEGSVNFVSETTCVICNNPPILPQSFGCQHLACYYCIYSSYASDPLFSCPLCGCQIHNKVQIIPTQVIRQE